MRFPEAVDYLLAYHGRSRDSPDRNKPIPRPKPPPPREKPPFVLPPANSDQRRVFAYLRKRGIASQVRFPSRSGTIPTSPPPLRAASPPNITTFCMSATRCQGTVNFAPDRSSRSSNISRKREKAALASWRRRLPEWGPHCPTTPLFKNWPPRSSRSLPNTRNRYGTMCSGKSRSGKSPRSGDARGRVFSVTPCLMYQGCQYITPCLRNGGTPSHPSTFPTSLHPCAHCAGTRAREIQSPSGW